MPEADTSPLAHERHLRCSAEHAFATYFARIGDWWDPRYTANADTLETVTIEPYAGGRVFATHRDIGDDDWGEVTTWEPGRRLVHSFVLAQDPEYPTEVTVEFLPVDEQVGSLVRLIHGGWRVANADDRNKFSDWPLLLGRFAELAEQE